MPPLSEKLIALVDEIDQDLAQTSRVDVQRRQPPCRDAGRKSESLGEGAGRHQLAHLLDQRFDRGRRAIKREMPRRNARCIEKVVDDATECGGRLHRGAASASVWTCDLSHDYVSINADYRS